MARDRRRRIIIGAAAAVTAAGVAAVVIARDDGAPADRDPSTAARPASQAAARAPVPGQNGLIAFMRPGSVGEYDIWVVRPDATRLRRLTQAPAYRSDYNPHWSPDGTRVLFERRVLDAETDGDDLFVVRADGTGLQQLTDCAKGCWADNEARWSPDGKRIVLNRASGPHSVGHPSQIAIWVAKADGSGMRRLTAPPRGYEDHYPTWSADGKTVVFERDRSTTPAGPSRLVAVNVASREERVLHRLPSWAPSAGNPRFSPDGRTILFGHWCAFGDGCPPDSREVRNATLATMRHDGRQRRVLRLQSPADSGAWSPDGEQIAFRCREGNEPTGPFALCTSRLDGSEFKRFPWPLESAHPDWGTHP